MDTTAGLEPPRTTLEAGQESRVTLSVRNDSEIVEDYSFQVVGDLAEWSSVEPTHVSVYPGQTSTAVVTLRPPRSSAVSAGEHPYGVHVRPAKRPEHATVPEGVVALLPFYDTVAELSPQSTKGRRGGKYLALVDNRGNAPVAVALAAKSASDGLDLALSETEQTMDPGTRWTSEIRAEPVKRLWRGVPVAYPFTIVVTPDEGPEFPLAGTQYQDPVLPAWFFKVLTALLAMVIALVVWSLAAGGFPPWNQSEDDFVPGPTSEPTDESGESSNDPVEGPGKESADESTGGSGERPTSESGEETGETPTDGSTDGSADGATVGPEGPDTVRLPSGMVGQLADPLIDQIRLLGVNVIRYDEPTADSVPGTVIRTEPVGGSPVMPGDTIEMWVASEPTVPEEPFSVLVPLSAPLTGTAESSWPQEPSEKVYIITKLLLENPQGDIGSFTLQLGDGVLYEGSFDSVSTGENLIREEGQEVGGAQATDDPQATGTIYELPLDQITVDPGQELLLTTACEEVGTGQVPPLTACNETFTLEGRAVDAAAVG